MNEPTTFEMEVEAEVEAMALEAASVEERRSEARRRVKRRGAVRGRAEAQAAHAKRMGAALAKAKTKESKKLVATFGKVAAAVDPATFYDLLTVSVAVRGEHSLGRAEGALLFAAADRKKSQARLREVRSLGPFDHAEPGECRRGDRLPEKLDTQLLAVDPTDAELAEIAKRLRG